MPRRGMAYLVSLIILLLIVPALCGCNIQRNMLYYPSAYLPSQDTLAARSLAFWPDGPGGYRGFVGTKGIGMPKGTVVVFHGNAGTAADRDYYTAALAPLGFRVILAEYPGYGGRNGKPGEDVLTADAVETLRLASEKYGGPLILLGESLGCGVAASAAKASTVPIDGIVLITPWDTLLSVAREHFPWLPVGLFLQDTYDTIGNLKGYQGRIAVIGAENDDIIPLRHAQTLFASLTGQKRMWTIRGAGHNDWPDQVGHVWWQEITDYIEGRQ